MQHYYSHIKVLTIRILFILLFFSLSRVFFFILNFSHFSFNSFYESVMAWIGGIRFDLSILIIFNFPFILLHLIPGNYKSNKIYQLILKVLFVLVNGVLLLSNFIDTEYYKFTDKRSTFDIFQLISTGEDFKNLWPVFIADYWYILLSWLIFVAGMWKFYPKLKNSSPSPFKFKNVIIQSVISICIIAISFFAWRGTGLRPISIINAAYYANSQNIPLVLNTPFSIVKSYDKTDIVEVEYFSDSTDLKKIYTTTVIPSQNKKFKPLNIVIIIVESLSKEYSGLPDSTETYTPFLDSLMQKSLVFVNSFANGKKSMEAIPAIISSLPSLMNNPYLISIYGLNKIDGFPKILKKEGYKTAFFHGGTNGTMNFDNYAKLVEFDNYYGQTEYNNDKDYDGNWGIFDEEFLQYTDKTINAFQQPFMAAIFTLSSHHPFTIPEKYDGKFKGGPMEILKSIEYTDYSIKKFFETASKMPWYNNTIFIITGDHTSYTSNPYYMNNIGMYSVPIVFYCPSDTSMHGIDSTYIQQIDILPSVLGYMNYNKPIFSFGKNVFDTTSEHLCVSHINGIYQLIENGYAFTFDGEQPIGLFNIRKDSLLRNNLLSTDSVIVQPMEEKLKAIIQTHNNCLINNKLTLDE